MQLVCRDQIEMFLDNPLATLEPVIVGVESLNHDKQIFIGLKEAKTIKALCSYLHHETEAFTVPYYVSRFDLIPSQTYFILIADDREYTAFFCLSHKNIIASLKGVKNGLMLSLKCGMSTKEEKIRNVLVCLRGNDLHKVVKETMEVALQQAGGLGKPIDKKLQLPKWLEGLGWESGISLGANVSHANVLEAAESLRRSGYNPSFILIDEGWQQLEVNAEDKSRKWTLQSFDADLKRFPKGIKGLVDDLHKLGVKHVGVWHGMMGYRGGIFPELARRYELPQAENGRYFLGYDLGRTFQFFYDYYTYLREQGISFIKVGDQNDVQAYCHAGMDPTFLYKNLQSAIQAAASIQFNSAHFNTDCLRNENLFYWGNSRLARSAQDIDIVNPVGMMCAIRNNLTNALWLQHLMQPDFDAWMTHIPENEMLAIFHALSGTINVIGDLPGEHHTNLLKKMMLPNGHILKGDRPLTLCEESIFFDPLEEKKIYKAFTMKGQHGIIAAFNLSTGRRTLHGTVAAHDVPGLKAGQFAVFSYHNGFVGLVDEGDQLEITLKPKQSDVFTFAPVKNGIAVLGCYTYYLAPGPLAEVNIEEDSIHISAMVAAPMIIYCERGILEVRRDGAVIPWEYDEIRRTLSIDSRSHIEAEHSVCSILFES